MNKLCFPFLLIIFLISCGSPGGSSNPEGGQNPDIPVEIPDTVTVSWEPDDENCLQFSTNDEDYLSTNGTSGWIWGNADFSTIDFEVDCIKVSGESAYGYGLVFGLQEDTDPADGLDDTGYNFYIILINTEGSYFLGQVINKNCEYITENWYSHASLLRGKNISNTIRVVQTSGAGEDPAFDIYFNGSTDPIEFVDNEDPKFYGGKCGYITTLSPNENFPFVPVDVRFEQVTPADIDISDTNQISPSLKSRTTMEILKDSPCIHQSLNCLFGELGSLGY